MLCGNEDGAEAKPIRPQRREGVSAAMARQPPRGCDRVADRAFHRFSSRLLSQTRLRRDDPPGRPGAHGPPSWRPVPHSQH
jgi:hypothetical protein